MALGVGAPFTTTNNTKHFHVLLLLDVLWYVLATNGGHSWLLVILFAIPPRDAHYLCGVGAYDLSLHYHVDERKKSSERPLPFDPT